jgi:serine protease inhibitor
MKPQSSTYIGRVVFVLFCLFGCSNADEFSELIAATNADSGEVNAGLVSGNTEFGFNLLHEIRNVDADKNIFISPFSVSLALAMTLNGAVGETQQTMINALELEGMDLQNINTSYAQLRLRLQTAAPEVQLSIANSLWARAGVPFKPNFLDHNRTFYDAEITALDFNAPEAADIINRWVEANTNGKIQKMVQPPINPQTVMFLINAIYFKGVWQLEFDKSNTRDHPFQLTDGGQKPVPTMFRTDDYLYYEGENFQAVSLPYGEEGQISMYVFLPSPASDLPRFSQKLDTANWDGWISQFRKTEVNIGLPRFKVEYEVSLNNPLKALGMEIAFDRGRADFSGMRPIPPNLFISNVKHKTFVEVNEEGTEAAAATSVEIGVTSVPPPPKSFIVDRPFFFAIRDNQTGTVLFMGAIIDPSG